LVIEKESTFVSALWGHFIRDALDELRAGKSPVRRTVNALIYARSLVDSMRYHGFPKEQLQAYMEKYPAALGKGLVVASVLDEKTSTLRPGDVVWSIEGQEIGPERYRMEKIFNATAAEKVTLGVFRRGKLIQVQAALETMDLFPIREMIFWGGAMFYEADRRVQQLFNIPRGRVVVSHVLPGSPFSNVFGSLMPEGGGLIIVIEKIHGQSVKTLADLKNLIPQVEEKKYLSLVYRDFGIFTEKEGGPFSINRRPKITGVDFLVKQSPPERLVFDGEQLTWTSLPLEKASLSPTLPAEKVSPDKAVGEGGGGQ